VRTLVFALASLGASAWKPEACDELADGVPCRKLYEHPQGSTFVSTCPIDTWTNADGCAAYLDGKSEADQCPQITCPVALGVTMKLVCSGGCCPTCWAPDHVVAVDRHTAESSQFVVDPNVKAPKHCAGVKCFTLICAAGQMEGYAEGACCSSCQAR